MKATRRHIFEAAPRTDIIVSGIMLYGNSWLTLIVVLFSAIFGQPTSLLTLLQLRYRIHSAHVDSSNFFNQDNQNQDFSFN